MVSPLKNNNVYSTKSNLYYKYCNFHGKDTKKSYLTQCIALSVITFEGVQKEQL